MKRRKVPQPRPEWIDAASALSGRWIYNAVEMAGLTQVELAERLGTSRGYVCDLMNGRTAARIDTLLRILDVCGLSVDTLRVKKKNHGIPH